MISEYEIRFTCELWEYTNGADGGGNGVGCLSDDGGMGDIFATVAEDDGKNYHFGNFGTETCASLSLLFLLSSSVFQLHGCLGIISTILCKLVKLARSSSRWAVPVSFFFFLRFAVFQLHGCLGNYFNYSAQTCETCASSSCWAVPVSFFAIL